MVLVLVTSKVDKAILLTPTKFLVKSLNPKLLNSIITLWYLKIHTKATWGLNNVKIWRPC